MTTMSARIDKAEFGALLRTLNEAKHALGGTQSDVCCYKG